ncbi:OTU domain-containing protein 5 isoform X2 [Hydra vulgaris]|uniref:ubiquitinyl hydrolase 1 n=1 Tax=Hydra vulgaris TaxID=6087 RepID=A0ABM4C5R4_HYDVU
MTILPKKKEQKNDEVERNRSRNRTTRSGEVVRNRNNQDENISESSNSLDKRDSQELLNLPLHKRSRHRQSSNYFSKNSRETREGSVSPPYDVSENGYNSSDEYDSLREIKKGVIKLDGPTAEQESEFEKQLLLKRGFQIKQMGTDGACLFRAVADQVYGDQEMHSVVRKHCIDYMVKNSDFFSQYVTEDFHTYVRRKRNDSIHGNHVEMQALSEIYNRPIEVYQYGCEPINIFHSRSSNSDENPPLRLSYHGSIHYNSVIDPYNPTVGVGLGLAGYKPGTHDQRLLQSTIQESEAQLLEQEMLQDKLKATDWEATDEHLTEVAARESYLEWVRENQSKEKNNGASSSTCTSSQIRNSPGHRSPSNESGSRCSPRGEKHINLSMLSKDNEATAKNNTCISLSTPNVDDWSYALGYSEDWDTDPVLAAVLAQSQQEYLQEISRLNSSVNKECDK